MRVLVLCTALISFKGLAVAEAQVSLTPGSVDLSATFEAISVRAKFSGDSNANATATIKFRKSQESAWHDAYKPLIDRRATIGGAANPYALEARGSIVGLISNTAYEVQVTWADPDGVSGTQPSVATVMTLSYTPPTGGSTITVTDNASLASALSSVNPGQTIHLNPGTYNAFTISRSGNSGAWIKVEGNAGGGSIVLGAGVSQNIRVNANFIILQHLTLSASDFYGIVTGSGTHHHFIQDNTLQNVSARCFDGPATTHYGDTGISVGGGASSVFILRNSVTSTALSGCVQSPPYDGAGTGIGWSNVTTLVVGSNTVTGAFRDAISSDSSNNAGQNVDVVGNTVSGYVDDGIESKGDNVNVRLWNNRSTAIQADSCIAGNTNTPTNLYGPLYVFRNTCRALGSGVPGGGAVYKITPAVPMYIFHNSSDSSAATSPSWTNFLMDAASGPYVVLNNIAVSSGSMSEHAPSGSTFNYNLGTSGSSWAYLWGGTTTYSTAAAFRAGTGQEVNGLNMNPVFIDTTLHIGIASPAVDKGVLLPNFNTRDSAWPYAGSAPDIGAFELQTSGAQSPAPPTNLQIQ